MIKVGIPRALLYYQYFPMWKTFFNELGAEVVVSNPTTKAMVASGSARVVADTCLPVKVFLGHTIDLVGNCDCIFIPAIRSVRRYIYNCSKFLGLPDMTRAVIPDSPPVLDIFVDITKGMRKLNKAIDKLGRFFTNDSSRIKRAALASWKVYQDYHGSMSERGLTPPQAIDGIPETEPSQSPSTQTTIALVGHPYLLYDEYLNHRLIHRLEQSGCSVLTPEMLTTEQLETGTINLVGTAYWTYGEEIVGAGEHFLQDGVDGVIGVVTFAKDLI